MDITYSFHQKSGESSSHLSQEQKSVFDEDLQKKIEENERLHIQVRKSCVFLYELKNGCVIWNVEETTHGRVFCMWVGVLPSPVVGGDICHRRSFISKISHFNTGVCFQYAWVQRIAE